MKNQLSEMNTLTINRQFLRKETKNRIYPSWGQISILKQPLTEGEVALATYLDNNLPNEWEIYLQPYLNGDRPDIVLLNENVGMMVIEVKDYKYGAYYSKPIRTRNGISKRNFQYFVKTSNRDIPISSPVNQVNRYRRKIMSLYVPEIGEVINENKRALAVIGIGVYMHKMNTIQAHDFIKGNKYCSVFGNDMLDNSNNISKIIPSVKIKKSIFFNKEMATKIRFWLMPPYHSIEQGKPIKLSKEQSRHVTLSPQQHQRLRGVAGSGKSMVIAQRAANLASEGKRVLIVTYNITLWHYLRDMISRVRLGFHWDRIEFNHFHYFCKDYLNENNVPWPTKKFTDADWLETIPSIVNTMISNGYNAKLRKYDAILIDEGQDYHKTWYNTLCKFLSKNDEMLFVIDEKQNIYERENNWVDNMRGTKFRGRWRTLNKSFRLPTMVAERAIEFSNKFLPDSGPEMMAIDNEINIFDPKLNWENMQSSELIGKKLIQHYKNLTEKMKEHPSDIGILVPDQKTGVAIVNMFKRKLNVESNHVFKMNDDDLFNNKRSFYMGDSRLKVCTIHSFKGWELKNLIILITDSANTIGQLDKLVYTSLTRTLSSLKVFNFNDRYAEYGNSWNETKY